MTKYLLFFIKNNYSLITQNIPQNTQITPQITQNIPQNILYNKNNKIDIYTTLLVDNNKYICCYCNKNLSRSDNLKRHQIKCKENNKIILSNLDQLSPKVSLTVDNNNNDNDDKKYIKEIENLRKELEIYKNKENGSKKRVIRKKKIGLNYKYNPTLA